jgi:hypothetical protein
MAVSTIWSACTSPSSSEQYLDDVARITEQMTNDSFAALPPGAAPTHQQVAEIVEARRAALVAIEGLEPPEELEPEHRVLIAALRAFVDAGTSFVEETAALGPDAFLDALEASTQIDRLADRVSASCDAIRLRAADLGHPVGLAC